MDVLITGASGLIGSALAPALEAAGHRVTRLARGDSAGDDPTWDPARGEIDASSLEGLDAVVHLAGAGIGDKRWTEARKREILESRSRSTRLLAETLAGLDRRPRLLVSGSAIGYYGAHRDEPLTEASPPGDDFLAQVCIEWERATEPAAQAAIRVVNIRSGIVLSADGGVLRRMLFPFKVGLGGRIGTGEQYMSWIAIDDEVGAILHLVGRDDLEGSVNLTAPNPVTNAEFTETMGRVVARPTPFRTPMRPLKMLYGTELVHSLLLAGQRVLPERLRASGYSFAHETLEGALRAVLGRAATS